MRHIRRAVPTDSEQAFNLVRDFATSFRPEPRAFRVAFPRLITQDDALLPVVEESEQLLGYVLAFDHYTLFANGRVSWVEEIMVREDRRRQRIGEELMRQCEQWAKSRESKLVALGTRRAAAFYLTLEHEESATYFRKLL